MDLGYHSGRKTVRICLQNEYDFALCKLQGLKTGAFDHEMRTFLRTGCFCLLENMIRPMKSPLSGPENTAGRIWIRIYQKSVIFSLIFASIIIQNLLSCIARSV